MYHVHWGYCGSHRQSFDRFDDALGKYAEHRGAQLIGDDYDADLDGGEFVQCNDGLTEEEREIVEATPWQR